MKYKIITGILVLCILNTQAQTKKSTITTGGQFQIKGTLKGVQDTMVCLSYTDASGKNRTDSTRTSKGKFAFKGNIEDVTMSSLYIKQRTGYPSEYATIFLEPI